MPDGFQFHIGTSGWHYKHWLVKFYPPRFPPAKMLSWYAREFLTVEINNSFYRLPDEKTFEKWKRAVPPGFLFAVKASRYVTHIKRLKDPEDSIKLFVSRAEHLGSTLGPVLFQLPPNLKADTERLEHFLKALPRRHRYVFEFRDERWLTTKVYELLRHYNAALCLHDWRGLPWAVEFTADFAYIRFHGSGMRYGGNYPDEVLRNWAKRIRGWKGMISDVFVYFNNDAQGYAVANACTLLTMLEKTSKDSLHRPGVAA